MEFWPANPGIFPSERSVLVVSAEAYVCAIAVADFDGLVFRERNRASGTNPETPLKGHGILDSVQTGLSAEPEVCIQGNPQPRLEIVTQVPLKCANRLLGLYLAVGEIPIAGEKFGIRREKPGPCIAIQNSVSRAL
jgi:hypothetical protein